MLKFFIPEHYSRPAQRLTVMQYLGMAVSSAVIDFYFHLHTIQALLHICYLKSFYDMIVIEIKIPLVEQMFDISHTVDMPVKIYIAVLENIF